MISAATSLLLHDSDGLGLVVFGYHSQYFNHDTCFPLSVDLDGISAGVPFVN